MDGNTTICMVTYYYGVVSIFSHEELQMDNVKDYIQYVGLLKDILLMESGIISLFIIFVMCMGEEWVKYKGIFNIYM
jgi:hypothetical protein